MSTQQIEDTSDWIIHPERNIFATQPFTAEGVVETWRNLGVGRPLQDGFAEFYAFAMNNCPSIPVPISEHWPNYTGKEAKRIAVELMKSERKTNE